MWYDGTNNDEGAIMDETLDITLRNDYNDKFTAERVGLPALLAMAAAVRDIDPNLYDTLVKAGYSLQYEEEEED